MLDSIKRVNSMALVTLRHIQLGFGGTPLLDDVSFSIADGEQICLLGRNGAGKSTLMKLIAGDLQPDDGEMAVRQGARIALLTQEVPDDLRGTVFDVVASGLGGLGDLVRSYHRLAVKLASAADESLLQQLADVQHQLEAAQGWQTGGDRSDAPAAGCGERVFRAFGGAQTAGVAGACTGQGAGPVTVG